MGIQTVYRPELGGDACVNCGAPRDQHGDTPLIRNCICPPPRPAPAPVQAPQSLPARRKGVPLAIQTPPPRPDGFASRKAARFAMAGALRAKQEKPTLAPTLCDGCGREIKKRVVMRQGKRWHRLCAPRLQGTAHWIPTGEPE